LADLALLGFEDAPRGLRVGGLGQGCPKVSHGACQLLVRAVDQNNGRTCVLQGRPRLNVKGGQVATAKDRGGSKGVQDSHGAIELAVDVMGKVFCDLEDAPLDFSLLEARHAVEAVDRKPEQWRGKCDGKEDQKGADALRRDTVLEDSCRHVVSEGSSGRATSRS
jgi:hypothetical protein